MVQANHHASLSLLVAAFAAVARARSCQDVAVPISISARNTNFALSPPTSDSEVTSFILNLAQAGKNSAAAIVSDGGDEFVDISGDYTITGTYCVPDSGPGRAVQILTHGIGFDRSYWDFSLSPRSSSSPFSFNRTQRNQTGYSSGNSADYSYVNAAIAQNYSTFAYDRLGTGGSLPSDGRPVDPVNELQAPVEVAVLRALTVALRSAGVPGVRTRYDKVVHVGHGYGSLLTYALVASSSSSQSSQPSYPASSPPSEQSSSPSTPYASPPFDSNQTSHYPTNNPSSKRTTGRALTFSPRLSRSSAYLGAVPVGNGTTPGGNSAGSGIPYNGGINGTSGNYTGGSSGSGELSDGIVLTSFGHTSRDYFSRFLLGANFVSASNAPDSSRPTNVSNFSSYPATTGVDSSDAGYPGGWLVPGDARGVQTYTVAPQGIDPAVLQAVYSDVQPVAVAELLSLSALASGQSAFAGPVLVVTGERDISVCGGNCLSSDPPIPARLEQYFTNASVFESSIVLGAGNGLNLEPSAETTFGSILDFLNGNV
ncbi:hypothetical protein GGS23DRAFT_28231 [Durotheca rogersii]|uniref:uncharacterized protein n=1 Tax=Durotheca rogersii TaxID=419775 RepID=UPI002220A376|nr:uncharacterized protein GGS23DRAFT_28231 [Durotheca rogersii]KAI5868409.1 hypothetical protein GGS23DRAFT_28231 [Durotheca rogersii]